jgi:hypothetical protein
VLCSSARAGAHRHVVEKRSATARDVGEEELDGAGRKRFRRHSSSTSRRPFVQRRPNAVAPPTSRSSPASMATANERELGGRGCLRGSWGWCGFNRVLGGAFYRPKQAVQKMADAGGLAMCIGDAGRGGLGSMLAGFGLGVGALWEALARSRRSASCRGQREREGGPGVFFLFPSMSHGPGRGRGGWGSTEGESTSMATGLGQMGTASATVV